MRDQPRRAYADIALFAIVGYTHIMLIQAYGLFWRTDEINWFPGKGKRGAFRLLGRWGSNLPGLRLADFREQHGIYILYGNYGPHYVGLTRKQALGKRLRDHLDDDHAGAWDRFCWFGFRSVLKAKNDLGLNPLKVLAEVSVGSPGHAIGDIEALLIKAMALRNKADMRFTRALEWTQVKLDEAAHYLNKARGW